MRVGELENKDMLVYHRKGKIEALMAARRKAEYLVEAVGKKLGDVIGLLKVKPSTFYRIQEYKARYVLLTLNHLTVSVP